MSTAEWRANNKDRLRGYKKKFYESNKAKVKAESVAYRKQTKEIVANIRNSTGCSVCPEKDPSCLDFHHKESSDKELSVAAAAARGVSRKLILKEIQKCIVLCSNCHRKLHKSAGLV